MVLKNSQKALSELLTNSLIATQILGFPLFYPQKPTIPFPTKNPIIPIVYTPGKMYFYPKPYNPYCLHTWQNVLLPEMYTPNQIENINGKPNIFTSSTCNLSSFGIFNMCMQRLVIFFSLFFYLFEVFVLKIQQTLKII